MEQSYPVSFEIEGPAAMFTRPDTGAAPVSYPVPTYSAAKGMFEAVARLKSSFIRPVKVELCAPIQFHKYVTNYGGPLRKGNQIAKGSSYQLVATILVDVCYRIHGIVETVSDPPRGINHLHALQEIFTRRIETGQYFYTPCLGWKEFTPSYLGPPRQHTQVDETINQIIPSMLYSVFDLHLGGQWNPQYRQNVRIKNGVLEYA